MIVATMSLEEKEAHVRGEVASVMRKFAAPMDRVRRSLRKTPGQRTLVRHFSYRSPRGMQWEVTAYCAKKYDKIFMTAWWHLDGVGLEAMALGPNDTYYFDTHFFQRYRERYSCTTSPTENLRGFLKSNYDLTCMVLKSERHGYRQVLVACNDGLILGTQRHGVLACDTYLSPKQLRPDQQAAYEDLRNAAVTPQHYLDAEVRIMRALDLLERSRPHNNH